MFANNSFYNGIQTFSGITFGAFEFAWMQGAFMRFDVLIFLALCLCPLAFLAGLKSKHVAAGVQTYALNRPYRHILADFLFYISVAASFATIVFVYSHDLKLSDQNWGVPPHTGILLANFVAFTIAMGLFSLLAKEERNKQERGRK
jgi:hypothetical protein